VVARLVEQQQLRRHFRVEQRSQRGLDPLATTQRAQRTQAALGIQAEQGQLGAQGAIAGHRVRALQQLQCRVLRG